MKICQDCLESWELTGLLTRTFAPITHDDAGLCGDTVYTVMDYGLTGNLGRLLRRVAGVQEVIPFAVELVPGQDPGLPTQASSDNPERAPTA